MTRTGLSHHCTPACPRVWVLTGAIFAVAAALLASAPAAWAVPFTSDLVVSVEADFDEGFAVADPEPNVTQSGSFSVREAGVDTTSFYSGDAVDVGSSDPLIGTLTDIGDGAGISADSMAVEFGAFGIGIDILIDLENTSATDTLKVTFKVDFNNSADTDGPEAYAESGYTVDDSGGEVFFTEVLSDAVFGDVRNGVDLGTFGELVVDAGISTFDIMLAPGAMESLEIAYTLEGEAFDEDADVAIVDFSAFISIDNVMNLTVPPTVPEPGTLMLLGGALLTLTGLGRRRV